jgi:hypothetical protein
VADSYLALSDFNVAKCLLTDVLSEKSTPKPTLVNAALRLSKIVRREGIHDQASDRHSVLWQAVNNLTAGSNETRLAVIEEVLCNVSISEHPKADIIRLIDLTLGEDVSNSSMGYKDEWQIVSLEKHKTKLERSTKNYRDQPPQIEQGPYLDLERPEPASKPLRPDHADAIDARYWTARSLFKQKKYEEAETLFRQVVQEREKVLVQEHADTVGQGVDLKRVVTSPADVEGPIPKAVPCKLVVFLDDKIFPHFEEARCYWNDASYFVILQNAAHRILEEQGNFHPRDESARLYKRAGRCRLVRREDDFEVESIIIENKRQWVQFLPLMVAKFAANNHFVQFYLDFRWEYSLLIINRQDGVAYAETVKGVLYDRLKRNHRNQEYIPRQVLDNLFKLSTVRELIDKDKSLKKLAQKLLTETGQLFDKDKFIAHVIADGIVYLALCIYTGLPLECLYRLTEKYKDCTTLLQVSDCPKGISKPQFDHLVELQGAFQAHTFPNNSGHPIHRQLDNRIVVPIKFDEKGDSIGRGRFGEVFRVQIEPDHHRFSPVCWHLRMFGCC